MEPSTTTSTPLFPPDFLTTVSTRQTYFSTQPSFPTILEPIPTLPLEAPQPIDTTFRQYATKLGYPDCLITRVLCDLGPDAERGDLLEHLINLQDMLSPKETAVRFRRDATHLPSYMLAQDSYYKGKEKMPFWVWVKRETIGVNVAANPPHRRSRTGSRTRSTSSSSAAQTSAHSAHRPPTTQ